MNTMYTKHLIYLFMMVFLMTTVMAAELPEQEENITINKEMCEKFFATEIIGINMTPFSPFPYETVNIYNFKGEALGNFMIVDNEIVNGNCSIAPKPSYNLFVEDAYTLSNILHEDVGLQTYVEKINQKEIAIKGTDFPKRLKVWFVNSIARFITWFMI